MKGGVGGREKREGGCGGEMGCMVQTKIMYVLTK
jgi:hypothetical protein